MGDGSGDGPLGAARRAERGKTATLHECRRGSNLVKRSLFTAAGDYANNHVTGLKPVIVRQQTKQG